MKPFCLLVLLFPIFIYSCSKSKLLNDTQYTEISKAIKKYKGKKGKYPENENSLFFQELIPYFDNILIFSSNIKIIFVEIHPITDPIVIQKIPIYLLVNDDGNAIKLVKKEKHDYSLEIDHRLAFAGNIIHGKLLNFNNNKPDSTFRDTTNFGYYYQQQLFFLKRDVSFIVNSIEAYKKQNNNYPEFCGKYFINYILPFIENKFSKDNIDFDLLLIENGLRIPIYRSSNSMGHFPFLSYCFNPTKNTYILYFTGKNGVDENGLGDDEQLNR